MIRRSGLQKGELEYSAIWTWPSGLIKNIAGSGKGCSVSLMLRGWLTYKPHLCMSVNLRPYAIRYVISLVSVVARRLSNCSQKESRLEAWSVGKYGMQGIKSNLQQQQ